MFDIGWSEFLIIGVVALIVIGPKDLPKAAKAVAQWVRKARSLAREFQSGLDEMMREAELDKVKKEFEESLDADQMGGSIRRDIEESLDTKSIDEAMRLEGDFTSPDFELYEESGARPAHAATAADEEKPTPDRDDASGGEPSAPDEVAGSEDSPPAKTGTS